MRPTSSIPLIDLFAGPGGLGEGFTSLVSNDGSRSFKIALSIEKDGFAHKTLTLRNFLRQFPPSKLPKEYYRALKEDDPNFESLYAKYPEEAANAKREAWNFELGNADNHKLVDERIRESLKGEKEFVLIGGPPCQAYSVVGRSRRQETAGLNKEDERVYLYREYYRILAVHQPALFVMENVKGLLSSKIDNKFIFKQLLHDLEHPVESYRKLKGHEPLGKIDIKYKIYSFVKKPKEFDLLTGAPILNQSDFIIRSEEYGIPQTRHRVILFGVREDLDILPKVLKSTPTPVPIQCVISDLPKIRSGLSRQLDGKKEWSDAIQEILSSKSFKSPNSVVLQEVIKTLTKKRNYKYDKGKEFLDAESGIEYLTSWYFDAKLKGILNHESRSHIKEDLHRYLFAACFAKVNKFSPKLSDFPHGLLPNHMNLKKGLEDKKFADRFRVQTYGLPAKTITSHISKDGNYYIHPDPNQCRTLTVREAARIQTFPDNYFFCGPRTQQFHQVGNAVPPYLAAQIAKIVLEAFLMMP